MRKRDGRDATASGAAYFGAEVAAWRYRKGLTQRELAELTTYTNSYVAMVETGERLGSEHFAGGCDRIFETPGTFVRLRHRASLRGHPEWFTKYVDLEAKATQIYDYSTDLVMGLLQTSGYAKAVFEAGYPRDETAVTKEKVQTRLLRRAVLNNESPALVWCVLDEGCLRRMVGGTQIMREQLASLLKDSESPHIVIQVLPYDSGAPARADSFNVLTFEDSPGIVYEEHHDNSQVIDSPVAVADAIVTYDRLRADALSPEASRALIRKVMEVLHDDS